MRIRQARTAEAEAIHSIVSAYAAQGILLPPSQFEALFVSAAHTDADIDRTLAAARASLQTISALK